MQFKILTTLTAALAVGQTTAQMSAKEVVKNIEDITDLSSDTNDIAKDISPVGVVTNAPKLIDNFRQIITTVSKDVTAMNQDSGDSDIDKDGQSAICDALTTFVKVHQELLNTVIGKSGILSATPFTAPVGAVLRALEGGVDKLAFGIIDLVPTCEDKAKSEVKKLDGTLDKAVNEYS